MVLYRPAAVLIVVTLVVTGCATTVPKGSDRAWYCQEAFSSVERPPLFKDVVRTSRYITMRDGVKLAIDLYLPKGLPVGERIPAMVMQTRYVRGMRFLWPFGHFLHDRFEPTIRYFVTRGYAWVYVDVRGSGASFGTRPYPYAPEEVRDGMEVADWIVNQPWSDGIIGSIGSSYTGDSAIFLLTTRHPAVKAIMPRYAFFDAYPDVIRPGGVHLSWLTECWGNLGDHLDTDTMGDYLGPPASWVLRGTRPVDEDRDGAMLAASIAEHAGNGDISSLALDIEYRDDVSPALGISMDAMSPHARLADLRAAGAPVYLYSGWFDASYVLSEINLFNNLDTPNKRLTIGPWEHGGWQYISPAAGGRRPTFSHEAEALRFFDESLKGLGHGMAGEKPVAYFTMVEEAWKFSDTWPPPGTETETLYLSANNRISATPPSGEDGFDEYRVDFTAGTGNHSRWDSLVNIMKAPIRYPDRREQDAKLLCYTTAPLPSAKEVTGHPVVTLYVTSTADDGAFFAYLEDVAPDGTVTYVTEGVLRAIHRRLSKEDAPYRVVTPYRTYLQKDAETLVPGRAAELIFDLYPTSYLFREGHSIRIAIAGADKDHFALLPDKPPTVRLLRGPAFPSHISLPVIRADRTAER